MKSGSAILWCVLAIVFADSTSLAWAESASSTMSIIARLRAAALSRGLPPDIAQAVGFVETGFDPSQIGASGEIGVMQVMPQTAAMLGFRGTKAELADVDTNLRYGVPYLASAWELAGHDLCRALNKYRAGHGAEIMTQKSVVYCQRARDYLASIHSQLAESVGLPIANRPPNGDAEMSLSRRSGGRGAGHGARFWARERARVEALTARVEARSALIAAYNERGRGAHPSHFGIAQLIAQLKTLRR